MRRFVVLCGLVALLALPAMAGDGKTMGCCAKGAGVERTVANIDNGVRITLTSTDAETVAMLQEKSAECAKDGCAGCPMHSEGVTRTVEKTDKGVVITATSTSPELVAKMQKHAAMEGMSCGKGEAKAGCCAKGKKAEAAGCGHGEKAAPATT